MGLQTCPSWACNSGLPYMDLTIVPPNKFIEIFKFDFFCRRVRNKRKQELLKKDNETSSFRQLDPLLPYLGI